MATSDYQSFNFALPQLPVSSMFKTNFLRQLGFQCLPGNSLIIFMHLCQLAA